MTVERRPVPTLLILTFSLEFLILVSGFRTSSAMYTVGDDTDAAPFTVEQLFPKHYASDGDATSPTLDFNAERGYKGEELFFHGTTLSLPRPHKFHSHRFTGKINWMIYPKANYTGVPTCLVADQDNLLTYNDEMPIMVGSIRRGCWCNYSIKVTPKPAIRDGGASGVQLWTGNNAQGHSLYTDGRETRLPYPVDMRSFQLMGRWKEWTVFEHADLSGDSRCLLADREGGENWLLYTNVPQVFRVRSIQEGCVAQTAFEYANGDGYLGNGSTKLVSWNLSLLIMVLFIGLLTKLNF